MNRDDWEGQVWYLDDNGRYAVRSTNAVSDEWGAATFWTVLDTNDDGQPEADYSWAPAFVWQLDMENVPEPPFLLIGDANGDGKVDIVDVTMTISHILGQNPAGFNKLAADVNGDGKVDIVDVTSIIDMILKQ